MDKRESENGCNFKSLIIWKGQCDPVLLNHWKGRRERLWPIGWGRENMIAMASVLDWTVDPVELEEHGWTLKKVA